MLVQSQGVPPSVFSLPGFTAQAATATTHSSAAATVTQVFGRFQRRTFLIRSFTLVSPKHSGLGEGKRRSVAKESSAML